MSSTSQQDDCLISCPKPQVGYEDYFNPTWFLDEPFTKQTFWYGSVGVDLSGLPWDAVQSGAGYNRIGHTLWAAGHTLAQYLTDNPEEVTGKRVLEVGCGLGLTGLVAAKLSTNPGGVVLTDGDENIMDAIQLNILNNFDDNVARPTCDVLYWGRAEVEGFVEKHGRFDVVLGADVLYTESSLEPLIDTVCAVMHDEPNAKLLIAFQPKYGGKLRDIVLALARSRDLVPSRVDWTTTQRTRLLDCIDEDDCNVELWQFLRDQTSTSSCNTT